MATKLCVLVNKRAFPEGTTPEEMHDYLIDSALFNFYGENSFGYFSPWDEGSAACVLDGMKAPDAVKAFAFGWADAYMHRLAQEIRKAVICSGMKDVTLEDFLMETPGALKTFSSCAKALQDEFDFQDSIYLNEEANFSVLIPEEDEKDIGNNPWDYIVIPVFYH